MNFDYVGNSFLRCQDVIYFIVVLILVVVDICYMVMDCVIVVFMNIQYGFIVQLVKMEIVWMIFVIVIIYQDLQFIDIFFVVIYFKMQGVEL